MPLTEPSFPISKPTVETGHTFTRRKTAETGPVGDSQLSKNLPYEAAFVFLSDSSAV